MAPNPDAPVCNTDHGIVKRCDELGRPMTLGNMTELGIRLRWGDSPKHADIR
jgi:hypothetical protein